MMFEVKHYNNIKNDDDNDNIKNTKNDQNVGY